MVQARVVTVKQLELFNTNCFKPVESRLSHLVVGIHEKVFLRAIIFGYMIVMMTIFIALFCIWCVKRNRVNSIAENLFLSIQST